ncbi:MAG: cyclodeaminase/cyclohydrolase family protein [Caldilineaceae bacterium]|nr:cyclodeaminase/cyclohydrolase family protein [Caldilineaceae bacterium]
MTIVPAALATADLTLRDFSDALAARHSTPGGGGAAALTGSQAAALLSMVINFTLGHKKYADVATKMQEWLAQSEALRHDLLALADRDVEVFNAVAACYAMPKATEAEKAARTTALQSALKAAAEVPFVVAEKCLTVLQLAAPVGEKGNANVVSDAGVAMYLAHAALHSALINVNINLKFIKDDDYVATYAAKRDALLAAAATAYAAARTACTNTLGIEL